MKVDNTGTLPSKEVPDSEKNRDYILKQIMAIHRLNGTYCMGSAARMLPNGIIDFGHDDNTGVTRNIYQNAAGFAEDRRWMAGLGTGEKYKKVHNMASKESTEVLTAMAVNWALPKFMLPIFDQLVENLWKRDTELIVTALDPLSNAVVEEAKQLAKAKIMVASDPEVKQMSERMGVADQLKLPEDHPQDLDEWEQWAGDDLVNAASKGVELALLHVDELDNYRDDVREQMAKELVATGVQVLASITNAAGIPERKSIRVEDAVLPWTNDNWRRMSYGGYYRRMTTGDIAREASGQLSEAAYKRIEDAKQIVAGNNVRLPGNIQEGTVLVFTCFFMDHLHYVAGDDADGFRVRIPSDGDTSAYENVRKTRYEVAFQGNWIVDTGMEEPLRSGEKEVPISWNCGLCWDMPRMKSTKGRTRLPIIAKAYRMEGMCVRSAARIGQDHYDNIAKIMYQTSHLLNNIIPPGATIDMQALIGVRNPDLTLVKPSEVVRVWRSTGLLMVNNFRGYDPENPQKTQQAVQVTDALIPNFTILMNQLMAEIALFERALGYNNIAAGGTVEERQGARVSQMQMQTADKNQAYLRNVQDRVEKEMYHVTYGQLQGIIRSGIGLKGQVKLFGVSGVKSFHLTADNDPADIGIELDVRPTEEERQSLLNEISSARMQNQITPGMAVSLRSMKNLKQMARMLDIYTARQTKVAQDNQMQLVQAQTQGNQQAAQMTAESMKQKVQFEAQARMTEKQAQWEYDSTEKDAQHSRDLDKIAKTFEGMISAKIAESQANTVSMLAQIMAKIGGEKEVTNLNNESKERIADQSNETKEEIAEKSANNRGGINKP